MWFIDRNRRPRHFESIKCGSSLDRAIRIGSHLHHREVDAWIGFSPRAVIKRKWESGTHGVLWSHWLSQQWRWWLVFILPSLRASPTLFSSDAHPAFIVQLPISASVLMVLSVGASVLHLSDALIDSCIFMRHSLESIVAVRRKGHRFALPSLDLMEKLRRTSAIRCHALRVLDSRNMLFLSVSLHSIIVRSIFPRISPCFSILWWTICAVFWAEQTLLKPTWTLLKSNWIPLWLV